MNALSNSTKSGDNSPGKSHQHTPGPWKATWHQVGNIKSDFSKLPKLPLVTTDFHESGKIKNGPEADVCYFADSPQIASECGASDFRHTITMEEAFANSLLIAAAPALLAACQRIAKDFAEGGFDAVTIGAIEDAIAAAAKAEGREA